MSHQLRALAVVCAATLSTPAWASFHKMQIEQVIGGVNGDVTKQAIQLRMRLSDQQFVSGARLRAWDASGGNPVLIVDMASDVADGSAGARVLITSANFNGSTSPPTVPDFTMTNTIPASYLAAGSLTFEDDSGDFIYWRLSWGGASYAGACDGARDNDADANFCPPFPESLPWTCTQSVDFTGPASAPSTNNAADYAVSGVGALWVNNASEVFTLPSSTIGACCVGAGCADAVHESDCAKFGGVFQGACSTCADAGCAPQATGACCLSDGACADGLTSDACINNGGVYQGDDSICKSISCPTVGACCLGDGSCIDGISAGDCGQSGGTFHGVGSTCDTVNCTPPEPGACCFTGSPCVELTASECSTAGGIFQGSGTTCETGSCPPPPQTGACCLTEACIQVTQGDCSKFAGTYQGDGTLCEKVVCTPPCPADIDDDGFINVNDLLEVIGQWGGSGSADVNGDSIVDVNDLLLVIGAWGPCPE
jgi:hypothetical protein